MAIEIGRSVAYVSRSISNHTFPAEVLAEPTAEIAAAIVRVMPDDGKEHLVAVATDTKGKPLACAIVSSGTVDSCMLYPRDVYSWALTVPNVRFVGVAHNHPSGDVTPSDPDKKSSAALAVAGIMLGVDLLWSLVVTHASDAWAIVPPPSGKRAKPGDEDTGKAKPEDEGEEQQGEQEEQGEQGEGEEQDEQDEDMDGEERDGEAPGEETTQTVTQFGGGGGSTASTDDLKSALAGLLAKVKR